jgi:acyl-CoA thioester hydrolase
MDDAQPEASGLRVVLPIRMDDLDTNGHVRGPAYLAYADRARWMALDAAGVALDALTARRIGPVNLQTTCFHRELLAPGEVEIRTVFEFDTGKTDRVLQRLYRSDQTLAAQVSSVSGLLDLAERRLLVCPSRYVREIAIRPDVLGLA